MSLLSAAVGRFRTRLTVVAVGCLLLALSPAAGASAAEVNDPWGEALAVRDALVAQINADRSAVGLQPLVYDWVLNEHAITSGADNKARCQAAREVRPPIAVYPGLRDQRRADLQARGYAAASTPVLDYDEAGVFLWRGAAPRTGPDNAKALATRARDALFTDEVSRLAGTPGMMLFGHPGVAAGATVSHIAVAVETAWCAARRSQITIVSVVTASIGGAPRA